MPDFDQFEVLYMNISLNLKKLTVISALRASSENELKVRFCKIDEVLFAGMAFA